MMTAAEETVVHPVAGHRAEHAAEEVAEETTTPAIGRSVAAATAHHAAASTGKRTNEGDYDPHTGADQQDWTNPPHACLPFHDRRRPVRIRTRLRDRRCRSFI